MRLYCCKITLTTDLKLCESRFEEPFWFTSSYHKCELNLTIIDSAAALLPNERENVRPMKNQPLMFEETLTTPLRETYGGSARKLGNYSAFQHRRP